MLLHIRGRYVYIYIIIYDSNKYSITQQRSTMYYCKCPAKINVVILLLILLNINNIQVVLSTIHKKTTNKIENSGTR